MRIAFDIIGSRERAIALVTDMNISAKKAKKFAEEICSRYKHVKSVIWKTGKKHKKYRIFPYKHLLGSKNYTVIHKEYGYKIKIDPTKAFFSVREGEERQRIAKKIKNGDSVLVLFAGVAPYAVAIAKQKRVSITCVEWNSSAVRYAKENIKLNKLKGIKILKGDVKKIKLGKFDKILMPLGTEAIKYLENAVSFAKKGSVIYLYGKSRDHGRDLKAEIKKKMKKKYRILRVQKVANYSPGVEKVRVDIKIL
jgi:tRNA (guanine37-N1)-methyltransferase